jgi:phosphomannomutase / phosphoglucomutase
MVDLKNALPKTWSSPTMSPHCADEAKYGLVARVVDQVMQKNGANVAGQSIRDLVTVNGVRVTVEDGSWGLVRAGLTPSPRAQGPTDRVPASLCIVQSSRKSDG